MPTEIKRKIGNPPMFIDEGVHCEIGGYGNDADGCFGGAVISYPDGACCSTKDDHFITYPDGACCDVNDNSKNVKLVFPNGNCCKENNKSVQLLFSNGNCCKEIEKKDYTYILQRYDEEGNVYVRLADAIKGSEDVTVTVRISQWGSDYDEYIVFDSSSTEEIKLKINVGYDRINRISSGYDIKFITDDDRINNRNSSEQIDEGNRS